MAVLIPVALLIVLGLAVVYVVFLRRAVRDGSGWRAVALTGAAAGIAALTLTALAGVLSFTPLLDALPFRDALGVLAFAGMPVAIVGLGCAALGLRSASRGPAVLGLIMSVISLVTWAMMLSVAG